MSSHLNAQVSAHRSTWCVTELWVLAAPEGAYHVTPLTLLGRSAEAFGPAVFEKKPLNAGVCMVPLS